ncbi:Uncharacterised protein [uncultured archaeon]|nr:Uncharacterised protein [uncultured archaeon]
MQTECAPKPVNVYNRLMAACAPPKLLSKSADFASPLTDGYQRVSACLPRSHSRFLQLTEMQVSPDLLRRKSCDMPVFSDLVLEARISAIERKNGRPWVHSPMGTEDVAVISKRSAAAAVLPALSQLEKSLAEELSGWRQNAKMPLRVKLNIARVVVAPVVAGASGGMLLASRSLVQGAIALVALGAGGLGAILAAERHFSDNGYAKTKAAVEDFAKFVQELREGAEAFLSNGKNGSNGKAIRYPEYL